MGVTEGQPAPEPGGYMGNFIGKKLELRELAKLSSTPILQMETLRLRAGKGA